MVVEVRAGRRENKINGNSFDNIIICNIYKCGSSFFLQRVGVVVGFCEGQVCGCGIKGIR